MADTIISVDFSGRGNVAEFDKRGSSKFQFDTNLLMKHRVKGVSVEMMHPAKEKVEIEIAGEHTAEPIKSIEDIDNISKYLISEGRYRDNMLFIIGINFGLRISDLLQLRFMHLINEDLTFKKTFPILEKKTKNTRKVRKNRYITINDAVIDAVLAYLSKNSRNLDDFLFRSEGNRGSKDNVPMSRQQADRILKGIGRDLNIGCKISTHTLRKTFAFHQMAMSNNDPRKLLLLQKMFGHATAAQTLDYIGITNEEMEEAYLGLNLGSGRNYLVDSTIYEGANSSAG